LADKGWGNYILLNFGLSNNCLFAGKASPKSAQFFKLKNFRYGEI